ncbi:hypothetical protein [Rhodoplanes roseus]|uniref:Uncharacterized protein n=1 Tax=Rhodoplanes roseus TaxID=29409 RepID=A0A327KTP1_9BRAD|nr:hypothetical protein [Rhodoplanes roseus]RAI42290.1 hypothetical protein CH341_19940 [Rhodoplanes roseus]
MGGKAMKILHMVVPALLALAGAAAADVRHTDVPDVLRGTWLPATETCPGPADAQLVLATQSYTRQGSTCRVDWVEERGATPGVIYSLHLRCGSATGETETNVIAWLKSPGIAAVGPSFDKLTELRICR